MDLIFIGDRPAQTCAITLNVLDPPLKYTGEKLDPFMVHDMVERYVTSKDNTPLHPQHQHGVADRRFVLSTGLAWAPKYDGMVAKQINTLVKYSRVSPIIYVLPVSSRHVLSHTINDKLAAVCSSSQSHREHTRFLLGLPECRLGKNYWRGFAGNDIHPTVPTPSEVLTILKVINTMNYVSESYT